MRKLIFVLMLLIASISVIGCVDSSPLSNADRQEIIISYSTITYPDMVPAVLWLGDVPELPGPGTVLTVVKMTIRNAGYDEFESDKRYFTAEAKDETFAYDSSCYANDLLPDTEVLEGDTITGNLTFMVSDPISASDITIKYAGPGNYQIRWIKDQDEKPHLRPIQ